MRFNLISNIANGVGLQRDYEMLRYELEQLGHKVHGVQFNRDQNAPLAEVNIFLEVVEPRFFAAGKENWVVPNPEWWFHGWDQHLKRINLVLAKTRHCEQLFQKRARTQFIGWKSRDLRDCSIPRQPRVLHLAGKSQTKNTPAVLTAWKKYGVQAELTLVSEHFRGAGLSHVSHIKRAGDEQLRELMNSHQFHLMPSGYEGWGHALHEGLGVGAVVITAGAPPMNEVAAEVFLPVVGSVQHHIAQVWAVDGKDVARAVRMAFKMSPASIREASDSARWAFLAECAGFDSRLRELVGEA
jgi:hypothetical protein